jgi:hypothetical protein
VRTGGPFDRWDLEVAGGVLGAARVRTVVEEHGRGRQLVRHRLTPRMPRWLGPATAMLGAGAIAAAHAAAWVAAAVLAVSAVTLLVAATAEAGASMAAALRAVEES